MASKSLPWDFEGTADCVLTLPVAPVTEESLFLLWFPDETNPAPSIDCCIWSQEVLSLHRWVFREAGTGEVRFNVSPRSPAFQQLLLVDSILRSSASLWFPERGWIMRHHPQVCLCISFLLTFLLWGFCLVKECESGLGAGQGWLTPFIIVTTRGAPGHGKSLMVLSVSLT